MSDKLQEVANYFIIRSRNEGNKAPVTNKKLQKLVYYAQAWNLVFNDEKLFEDDIEAWIHGPAIPELYRKYKKYGHQAILDEIEQSEFSFTPEELKVLNDVWRIYGKFDGDYLEMLTHSEEPWIIARGQAEESEASQAVINVVIMKEYYTQINKNGK